MKTLDFSIFVTVKISRDMIPRKKVSTCMINLLTGNLKINPNSKNICSKASE